MGQPLAPLLVMLPGLDGTGKLFTKFIDCLDGGLDAQVLGYPKDVPLGYEELERLIRPMLPSGRPFVLLAESFGGPLAIRLAASRPPGLLGIVLCTTFAKNPFPLWGWASPLAPLVPIHSLPRWFRAVVMWGSHKPATAPAQSERAIAGVSRNVVARRIEALLTLDAGAYLRQVEVASMIIYGSHDRVISFAATQWLAARLPRARVVCLEGPHLLLQSKPRECAALITDFVRKCGRILEGACASVECADRSRSAE